jgi:hypothetical protein
MANVAYSDPVFDFDLHELVKPSEVVADLIQGLVINAQYYVGPDRRRERRYALAEAATAVEVDAGFGTVGEPFVAVTRDISKGGLCLYHTREVQEKFVAVCLPDPTGDSVQLLMEVLRCRPLGMLYEVAGRFVTS